MNSVLGGSDFAITHGQAHGVGCYLAARDTRNAVLAAAAAAIVVVVVVVVVASSSSNSSRHVLSNCCL